MQIFAGDQGTLPSFSVLFHLLLQFECITAIWTVAAQRFESSIV